jgi:parvulin-like peptidyl-prolyl isomerase
VSEVFFDFPPAADEADEKETRERAERVQAEVAKAPASFELAARIHSGAPSASYGGKRGCLIAAEGDEEGAQLVKAVEGLAPGTLSPLVATSRGLYLLRVEQRVTKEESGNIGRFFVALPTVVLESASAVTRQFADNLKARMASGAAMQDALEQLTRETLKASPVLARAGNKAAELETAALESRERPQVDVSPSFTRGGVTSPVPNAVSGAAAKQLAFSLKAVGDVYPEPIDTYEGLAVLQLKDTEPAKREDFEKNKAEYMEQFKARAESDALTAFVARLKKAKESEIQINERFLDAATQASDDS